MAQYPSLPEMAHLEHLFTAFPKGARPLLELHDALLRSKDSAFSVVEREMIAAYVSGLNACAFCFGAHRTMAQAFGADPDTVDALLKDVETAPIEDRLKPVFAYVRKVSQRDAVTWQDAKAVFDAGWPEDALHDAIMITGLYNLMNRVVDGSGLAMKASYERPSAGDLDARRKGTYVGWGEAAGFLAGPPKG